MADIDATDGDNTLIDISLLKDRSISTRRELNEAEAENILEAYRKYMTAKVTVHLAPFDTTWMCRLHEQMFDKVWLYAGRTRQSNLNIGVAWTQVLPQLLELENDLNYWREHVTYSLLEQAVRLHHRGTWIHPFLGGNGRWSRLLANIWLRRWGETPVLWPTEIVNTASTIRKEYIQAIKAADEHNFEALIDLHHRYCEST